MQRRFKWLKRNFKLILMCIITVVVVIALAIILGPRGWIRLLDLPLDGLLTVLSVIIGLPCIICASIKGFLSKRRKKFIKEHLEVWLKQQYPNARYDTERYFVTSSYGGRTTDNQVNRIDAKIFCSYNRLEGSNFLSNVTRDGTPFQYCNLWCETGYSNVRHDAHTMFDGGILATVCNVPKANKSAIILEGKEDKSDINTTGYNILSTENIEFNNHFNCYCNNDENFFFICTPQLLEKLLVVRQYIGDFSMCIETNGIVTISGHDFNFFNKTRNVKKLKELVANNMELLVWIVETLRYYIDRNSTEPTGTIPTLTNYNKNYNGELEAVTNEQDSAGRLHNF